MLPCASLPQTTPWLFSLRYICSFTPVRFPLAFASHYRIVMRVKSQTSWIKAAGILASLIVVITYLFRPAPALTLRAQASDTPLLASESTNTVLSQLNTDRQLRFECPPCIANCLTESVRLAECPSPPPEKLCSDCAACPDVLMPIQCPEQVKCEACSTAVALQPQVYLENGSVDKEVLIELVRKVIRACVVCFVHSIG